jgi:tRNA G18 (ribose-2'-O)-methylase SpoU
MALIPISTLDDPRITDYLDIRDAEMRRTRFDAPGGLFVAEGELVFRRLLDSAFRTRSVLVTPTRIGSVQDALDRLDAATPVFCVDQALMNSIVGFNIHRGILAIGERGPEPDPRVLLARASVAVVLEDLVNHDNVGGIFRNVAAIAGLPDAGQGGGGGVVLLSPRCSDPLYRKAIRVSMGWVLGVPYARLSAWPDGLREVREAGFRVAALDPGPGSIELASFVEGLPRGARVAFVAGTEGAGLSGGVLDLADARVRIPMRGSPRVDSLNVGVAVAVALDRVAPKLGV